MLSLHAGTLLNVMITTPSGDTEVVKVVCDAGDLMCFGARCVHSGSSSVEGSLRVHIYTLKVSVPGLHEADSYEDETEPMLAEEPGFVATERLDGIRRVKSEDLDTFSFVDT